MSDSGGDPACWSHLTCPTCGRVHEPGGGCDDHATPVADVQVVGPLDRGSAGVASTQLNATCVVLRPAQSLPPAQLDRDVAFVVTSGSGSMTIGTDPGQQLDLVPGRTVVVPAGSRRVIVAGDDGLAWTTVHRRREPG